MSLCSVAIFRIPRRQMMSAYPSHLVDSVYSHTSSTSPFSQEPNTICFPQFHHQTSITKISLDHNEAGIINNSSSNQMAFDEVESGERVIRHKLGVSMDNNNNNKKKKFNSGEPKDRDDSMDRRSKKHKKSKEEEEEAESGRYVHVRARRGEATDSHSLAERVRREKISERMKTLQSLVPGCEKVCGKALMLDEIINYVQSMQNQVQFLSTKLASFTPNFIDQQQQGNPNESTGMVMNTLGTLNNYHPMMDGADVYQQCQLPNILLHNQSDGVEVLWNVEEERQSFNSDSGLLNNNYYATLI